MNNKIDLYYYSGTGNTYLVVKEMESIFKEYSMNVNIIKIEETDPAKINTKATIGLAFPVAFQSTYPFIWKFFKGLPDSNGTDIFMVDTLMAFSGAIIGPLKKLLKKKGYNCIGVKEIKMPSNFLPKKINKIKNKTLINKGLKEARSFTIDLIKGKTSWNRIPLLSDILYKLCCNDYMMKNINTALGKKITVNTKICKQCGLCHKLCPVDNIIMKKYPEWSDKCQLCMRCLSFCPVRAVYIPNKDFTPYKSVNVGQINIKGAKNELA